MAWFTSLVILWENQWLLNLGLKGFFPMAFNLNSQGETSAMSHESYINKSRLSQKQY
jgi:hypothetical protein